MQRLGNNVDGNAAFCAMVCNRQQDLPLRAADVEGSCPNAVKLLNGEIDRDNIPGQAFQRILIALSRFRRCRHRSLTNR